MVMTQMTTTNLSVMMMMVIPVMSVHLEPMTVPMMVMMLTVMEFVMQEIHVPMMQIMI